MSLLPPGAVHSAAAIASFKARREAVAYGLGSIVKTYHSVAHGINGSNIVVGTEHLGGDSRAFRTQLGGSMQYLPLCAGFTASEAHDIDDTGEVVGFCKRSSGGNQAFVWTQAGGLKLLPLRPRTPSAAAPPTRSTRAA